MSTPPGSLLIQAKTQGQDQQPRELLGCSVHSFSVRIIVMRQSAASRRSTSKRALLQLCPASPAGEANDLPESQPCCNDQRSVCVCAVGL